ncbi:MAG: type II secretion system F family protein [bacterium]
MPKFHYTAMDSKGREVEGVLDGENEARVIAVIKEKGLFPTKVTGVARKQSGPARPGQAGKSSKAGSSGMQTEIRMPKFIERFFEGRVKSKQLAIFTRQLATLVDAGLPLLRGLHVLQRQEQHPALRRAVTGMAESVESGSTFAEAMAQHPRVFSMFFVNMVKAGEVSGALHTVLSRLAEFLEKSERIKNKVRGAMVYPIVVGCVAVLIVSVLMVVVVPKFDEIFKDLLAGAPMPALTMAVVGFSKLMMHQGWIAVIVVGAGVFLWKLFARTPTGKVLLDNIKLRLPVFGSLVRRTAIANFTRTLGTLLTGGVPILQALHIVRDVTTNAVLAKAINQVHDSVKEGETIVTPMEASHVFPGMVVSMIQVGEETGALPEMLMKIAATYDDEVDAAVEGLTSIIEPIMIILLAGVVGTIVIAMFLPMISIIGKLSG